MAESSVTGQELVVSRPADDIDIIVDAHGEALVLADAGTDQLAAALQWLRDQESVSRELKAAIGRELHVRMDREARWTLDSGDWGVSGQSPDRVTYDAEALWNELEQLVAEDLIPPAAMAAAVDREYAYKARVAGINRLNKLGGAIAAAVERCTVSVDPRSRKVTIKRRPSQ